MIDYTRWSSLFNNPDWNSRADTILPFIPDGNSVIDIGCGTQYLRSCFPSDKYFGVDIVERPNCIFIDSLDDILFPLDITCGPKTYILLGVLEYLLRPVDLLKHLLLSGDQVIFSYTPIDLVEDLQERQSNGWASHLAWEELIAEIPGDCIQQSFQHNQQRIIVAQSPCALSSMVGQDAEFGAILSAESSKLDAAAPSSHKDDSIEDGSTLLRTSGLTKGRESIVVTGFFGRGNIGDEAMLQVIFEAFHHEYNVVISADLNGARSGFWDWYPYSSCEIIHHGDLKALTDPSVCGFITGGGALPLGFASSQKTIASALSKPTFLAGVDDTIYFLKGDSFDENFASSYLSSYSYFSTRSTRSFERIKPIAHNARLGSDWAWGLKPDERDMEQSDYICLVIREMPKSYIDHVLIDSYQRLLGYLRGLGVRLVLMPFCPEDELFVQSISAFEEVEVFRCWWNPRLALQFISLSSALVSVGRLHPIVFASKSNIPVIAIDYDFAHMDASFEPDPKILDLCTEFMIPYYSSIPSFLSSAHSLEFPFPREDTTHVNHGYDLRYQSQLSDIAEIIRR
ncbi:polysaccharide pyruvyl transferase family protein [Cyanobium sp. Morenito 9A2]|uniref:polysaccharide pyruvyl transferase family protein n=1 Tax=Cyanobium sp. Morenito 9A2 TaxID=2823718 RepID=UPI0020CF6929|nr:polysaccharide pyruvyl transferase family protein [Cyanobium sp. Morenito 9A2]MCP9848320.1 polysaccharide pyruvyl transferase family protein [Cyanobium sp. Morenito 9A2]